MLAVLGTNFIVFYAVAAALGLIFAVLFFVALFRKKRRRNAGDVIMIIFGVIVMLAALVAGMFAVINKFKPFGVSAFDENGILSLWFNEKRLFGVPKAGLLVGVFEEFALIGVIVPFALLFVCFVSVVTLGAKTFRRRKLKEESLDLQARTDEPSDEEIEKPAEQTDVSDSDRVTEDLPQENLPQEDYITTVDESEEYSEREEDELPPVVEDEESAENVLNIFDEINRLVPGSEENGNGASIGDELKKAIEEGVALSDTLSRPADFGGEDSELEESEDEYPYIEDENSEEDLEPEEESARDERAETEETESTNGWAYDETEEETDGVYHGTISESEPEDVPLEIKPKRKITPIAPSELPAARVRTIIRRPTAKSIKDIEKRVESILERDESLRERPATETVEKTTSQKKQAKSTSKPKTAPKKAKPQVGKSPVAEVKPVEAQSGGLPLTRKYIILNRRSAATIFNEYLNSKRENEKEELKGSLNTIIMK